MRDRRGCAARRTLRREYWLNPPFLRSQSTDPTSDEPKPTGVLLIPKTFLLIEQICPRTSQVDNLRTPVSILLQARTFKAVERVTDPLATAHDALVLVVSKGAFVADADEGGRAYVGVADGTFAVAFVAQAADGDAGLFAAHDEVGVMAGHGCGEVME